MTTLILSTRQTADNQALWRAAIQRGWSVIRARGLHVPETDDTEIVLYVEALFAPTIARQLARQLDELPEDWLVQLPHRFRRRDIAIGTLGDARRLARPMFVKPPNEKSFSARVYETGADLPQEFDNDMSVLMATPVSWDAEFRCFCLDGQVQACSPYLRHGVLARQTDFRMTADEEQKAIGLTETVLREHNSQLPRAVVVDVGCLRNGDWAVVEANAAWGSGIYGCDPDRVLDVVRHATQLR